MLGLQWHRWCVSSALLKVNHHSTLIIGCSQNIVFVMNRFPHRASKFTECTSSFCYDFCHLHVLWREVALTLTFLFSVIVHGQRLEVPLICTCASRKYFQVYIKWRLRVGISHEPLTCILSLWPSKTMTYAKKYVSTPTSFLLFSFFSWSCRAIGYYVSKMARQGLIGIMMAGSPPVVSPHGSKDRMFGTNPIAIGVPTEVWIMQYVWICVCVCVCFSWTIENSHSVGNNAFHVW